MPDIPRNKLAVAPLKRKKDSAYLLAGAHGTTIADEEL